MLALDKSHERKAECSSSGRTTSETGMRLERLSSPFFPIDLPARCITFQLPGYDRRVGSDVAFARENKGSRNSEPCPSAERRSA
jgi:hypothetical protein